MMTHALMPKRRRGRDGFSAPGARVPAPRARARPLCRRDADRQSRRRHPARARRCSAAADAILAEDTRVIPPPARPLRHRDAARRPITSTTPPKRVRASLAPPRRGQALALISDAGTPLISDPGYKLVAEAVAAGVAVHPRRPAPRAALAALASPALPTDRFFFEGFLPPQGAARRGADQRAGARCRRRSSSTRRRSRLAEALADLAAELGPRPAAVARELTKLHEESAARRSTALAADYAAADAPKGEIVVVVGPPPRAAARPAPRRSTR